MNRNAESRFAINPTNIRLPRSKFARPQSHKTTFNAGQIIPFYLDEVLPGDTHQIDTSYLVRMQTLVAPIMDNVYLDTYYFFVPNRLVWKHWQQFMGENTESAWIPQTEYSVPQVKCPEGGWNVGTVADYLGIPTGVDLGDTTVNALPFRGYALICNEFFRDENLTDPLNIPTGDATQTGSNGSSYINDVANGGLPFVAAKYHDYFTSALPSPQKGPDVSINLAGLSDESVPVFGNGNTLGLYDGVTNVGLGTTHTSYNSMYLGGSASVIYGAPAGTETSTYSGSSAYKSLGVVTKAQAGDNPEYSGMVADVSGLSTTDVITINQLREAFAIQKFYEKSARGGSRYIETLKAHFGVTSPDARLQRPEYLGGTRCTLNVNQVIQTSQTDSTPLGDTAAYSLTTNNSSDFTRSFVEHGFIFGLAVVRFDNSYQQGIERMWSRKDMFDYYWPEFSNLGEQAILNKEIYAQGSTVVNPNTNVAYDDEVFGYQEYAAEYRYKPSRISGEMRSTYQTSLDNWHLADYYTSMPYLSDSWIREDATVLDRALAVQSNVSDQLFGDFYVRDITTRCMPVYSIPGSF